MAPSQGKWWEEYHFFWETICFVIDLISVSTTTLHCILCSNTKSLHLVHWYYNHFRVLHWKWKFSFLCCRSFLAINKKFASSTCLSFEKICHTKILYQFPQDDIDSMTQVFEVCNSSFVHITSISIYIANGIMLVIFSKSDAQCIIKMEKLLAWFNLNWVA